VPPGVQFVEIGSSDIDRSLDRYQSMLRLAFFQDPDGALLEIIDGHLHYHNVVSPELAERERTAAQRRPKEAAPIFHHVALTVSDLDGVPLPAVNAR